ncbi:hypothetical protein JW887_01180 [Candidatus Dojkabacteria bacterium]|nr:hypothetical protein [Candidatus Dojkabacteria bacterium]
MTKFSKTLTKIKKVVVISAFIFICGFVGTKILTKDKISKNVDLWDSWISDIHADANVYFSDNLGNPIPAIDPNFPFYVTVIDNSSNFDETVTETIEVYLKSQTGDVLSVELTETSINSGIFRNTAGINAVIGKNPVTDTNLQVGLGQSVLISYENKFIEEVSATEENRLRIRHYARLAGDSTATDCSDTYDTDLIEAYYNGDETSFDPNNDAALTYIPTDPSEFPYYIDWSTETDDSRLVCFHADQGFCGSGYIDYDYLTDQEKHTAGAYSEIDETWDINNTDFYSWDPDDDQCSGWEVTFVDVPVNSMYQISDITLEFSIDNSRLLEYAEQNDMFLLLYNPISDEWEVVDVYADSDYNGYPYPLGWNSNYSRSAALSDYFFNDSGNNYMRFAFVGYNFTFKSAGSSLYFNKVIADITYEQSGMDLLNVISGTSSISGIVWNDENKDGIMDASEPRLDGVLVGLYDSDGDPIAITTANSSGEYSFTGLGAGTYSVYEVDRLDYTSPSLTSDNIITVTIADDETLTQVNFSDVLYQSSSTTQQEVVTIYDIIYLPATGSNIVLPFVLGSTSFGILLVILKKRKLLTA